MSDQDNLRDRIKRVVDVHDEKFFDGDYQTTLAQAIIDEFGLTVEYEQSWFVGLRDDNGMLIKDAKAARIVGKWEKQ